MPNAVVMFSGGAGSWAAAKRAVARHGLGAVTLLFCDTLVEDPDLYRFLGEAATNVFAGRRPRRSEYPSRRSYAARHRAWRREAKRARRQYVRIADGRDIWQVFRDERYLGNTRADPCSKILKRQLADRWMEKHRDAATTVRIVGIDWSEEHRFHGLRDRLGAAGWRVEAPMCDAPYLDKTQVIAWLEGEGIRPPRLYTLGFAHNNCGGGCVKAGIGHFAHLLRTLPDVYATWERNEADMRAFLGRDVAILRDRRGGTTKPLTLTQLRRRINGGGEVDEYDIGGCGCFAEPEAA